MGAGAFSTDAAGLLHFERPFFLSRAQPLPAAAPSPEMLSWLQQSPVSLQSHSQPRAKHSFTRAQLRAAAELK